VCTILFADCFRSARSLGLTESLDLLVSALPMTFGMRPLLRCAELGVRGAEIGQIVQIDMSKLRRGAAQASEVCPIKHLPV